LVQIKFDAIMHSDINSGTFIATVVNENGLQETGTRFNSSTFNRFVWKIHRRYYSYHNYDITFGNSNKSIIICDRIPITTTYDFWKKIKYMIIAIRGLCLEIPCAGCNGAYLKWERRCLCCDQPHVTEEDPAIINVETEFNQLMEGVFGEGY